MERHNSYVTHMKLKTEKKNKFNTQKVVPRKWKRMKIILSHSTDLMLYIQLSRNIYVCQRDKSNTTILYIFFLLFFFGLSRLDKQLTMWNRQNTESFVCRYIRIQNVKFVWIVDKCDFIVFFDVVVVVEYDYAWLDRNTALIEWQKVYLNVILKTLFELLPILIRMIW